MPLRLIRRALGRTPEPVHLVAPGPLRDRYDVVIIGGGGHGLACAYYLARDHGITDVAVLEAGYLGGGNTARNTAIVRANYLTPEGVRFYDESVRLFQGLSGELDINLMLSERGHLTLAHTDATLRTARWRAEVNRHMGVDSSLIDRAEIARLCPQLNLSEAVRYPVLGALYHPPGAIARHDAVAWGYGGLASQMGVQIHQATPVTGLTVANGRISHVVTAEKPVACGLAMQAVAGRSALVAGLAGLRLPLRAVPLQAAVSLPMKRFLDPIIVSGSLHVYVSQTARGELVLGGATDPYPLYASRSTLGFKEELALHLLELFPQLADARLLRQWAGIADITPDFSPLMGETPIRGYYLDAGWGTWGFKATPVVGKRMAELLATGQTPDILEPFRLSRFDDLTLIGERGAAAVGH